MSNSNGKKLKSTLQSRRLVVPLVAILLLTNFQIGTRAVSAVDAGVTTVVTHDPAAATLVTGELQPVTTSGTFDFWQTDAHVDCNLVSYTNLNNGLPSVKYFNLLTNTEFSVPNDPEPYAETFLSDVSGSRVAYSLTTLEGNVLVSRINVFDAATNITFRVPGDTYLRNSTIGGDLVAFESREDLRQTTVGVQVYDFGTGTLTQLANEDNVLNLDPAVSSNGNVVAFEKCTSPRTNCDVYSAVRTTTGTFSMSQLTGPAAEEMNADTNGTLVVYESLSNGDRDIAYQPVGGGAETRIAIPGFQRNPNVIGNLISFESSAVDFGDSEILLYDTSTNRLYRPVLPAPTKVLNDITFCNGQYRIVYATPGPNLGLDIHAFTFQLPESTSDEIDDLIALVRSFNLKDGTESSLIAKLESALEALDEGDTATACVSLSAFVNEVQAQSDKKIPVTQAYQLINSANQIKQELGCQ